jgi:hypothetical protein
MKVFEAALPPDHIHVPETKLRLRAPPCSREHRHYYSMKRIYRLDRMLSKRTLARRQPNYACSPPNLPVVPKLLNVSKVRSAAIQAQIPRNLVECPLWGNFLDVVEGRLWAVFANPFLVDA